MAGKKHFREIEKMLTKCGYVFDHQNAKAQWVYVRESTADIIVTPGIGEVPARKMLRDLQKLAGEFKARPKRNPAAVRDRQKEDRERLAERAAHLAAERADILRRRDASLSGLGARLSDAEISAIASRLEQIERDERAIQSLMNAPVTGPHSGVRQAQHRAGAHP